MDLTEAEDIKDTWQEYTEELYKRDLHEPDNHDGVISHLEPDILECKGKRALVTAEELRMLLYIFEDIAKIYRRGTRVLCQGYAITSPLFL